MATSYLSKPETNFVCFAKVCVDVVKIPLIDILFDQIKPDDLYHKIKSCAALSAENGKLVPDQKKICYLSPPHLPDYKSFDVTLLYTLIRNLCPSLEPTQGWGIKPKATHTKIGDDIERLRLFRNSFAHGESTEINDDEFDDIWKEIKSVIQRMQASTNPLKKYELELINIEGCRFGYEDREKYKTFLGVTLQMWKHIEGKYEPQICIKGAQEVLCGETTHFDADLKQFDSQTWSMYWQKTREKTTEQIDTVKDKYKNSSNLRLTVNFVSKEDEGEYQVVLARKHNGGDYKLCSNRIYLTPIGEKPYFTRWKITTGKKKITINYSYKISERSPKVLKIEWTKNGENIEIKTGKYDGGGLNDGFFILKSPTIDDIGNYSCTVTNAVGSASEHADFDLPIANISTNSGPIFGSNTIITSRISSCPSLEGVEWQKSIDGNTFNCIDISQPRYKGSRIEPESPLLVIPKTTFEDKLHYRLLVWNIFGRCISDPLHLIVTGSPPNVLTSHRIYFEHQSVKLIGTVFVSEKSPAVHTVFWTKNGEKIVTSERGGRYSEVSVDHPSLTINSVNSHDIGAYQLNAINAVGSTASDTIVLDEPRICVERKENPDSSHCFIAQIQSVPAAYHSQWMVKGKDDDTFKPVDINDEEFKGSSNALPRPILVVKHNQLLKENCFVIEVQNFVGRKTHCFAGRGHLKTRRCKRMSTEALIDKKLGDVNSLCESWGFNVGDIINSIRLNAQELSEMALGTIDVLFESSKSQQSWKDKNVIITAVHILGKVLMLVGSPVHVTGVSSDVVRLADCFLNIFFRVCNPNIEAMLDLGDSTTDGYDYVDLAERFKTLNIFLNEQELTENFDEPDLSDFIANIDIYIGIDEIGIVQNRIKEMMYGPRDQSQPYLNYLKVFLRMCTFRHVLLLRVMNCLIARQYSLRTVNTLRNFIEKERVDNRCFLKFFSLPNLESTEIVAEFEPSEHTELAAYLREVRLPFQDLREILHDRIFLIQSFVNPFVFLARQNSIFSNAVTLTFTKRVLSTDNNQFKFIAKDNSFNLFYIQSPNSDKCVYIEGNTIKQGQEAMHRAAQWRVLQVYRSDGGDKTASCFVICAKQRPSRFVYLKKDRKCLVNHSKPNDECLFVLIPIGESPILVSRPMERNLIDELQEMPSFTQMKSRNVQIRITNFRKIKDFLQKEHAMIANDIDQIEKYISYEGIEELIMLNPLLEKIAKTVDSTKGDNFDEHTMHALQQMISICCQYFLDEFPFGSILRQLLRLCGVLISCIWHAHGIDKLFCTFLSDSDKYYQLAIQKDVRCLQRVAFLLHEIERCENIQEKHISYIMNKDRFLVELRSLASLRETAKATHHPQMMVTSLKVSILQLAVMWQKFAITLYPGHSDNYAKKLRQIIQSEMTEDVCLINKFNEKRQCQRCTKIAVDMWVVDDYVSCLGCDLPNDRERRTRRNLKKMFLVVVPLLKRIFQRSPERYTQLDNPN